MAYLRHNCVEISTRRTRSLHYKSNAPDIGLFEGIDALRNVLNRCWFEEAKCAKGITALENYKKQWNNRHGCWSSHPLHNFAIHRADAFRMIAVGIGKFVSKGLSGGMADFKRAICH